jgi:hypothetical protein
VSGDVVVDLGIQEFNIPVNASSCALAHFIAAQALGLFGGVAWVKARRSPPMDIELHSGASFRLFHAYDCRSAVPRVANQFQRSAASRRDETKTRCTGRHHSGGLEALPDERLDGDAAQNRLIASEFYIRGAIDNHLNGASALVRTPRSD